MLRPAELELAENVPGAGCTAESAQQYTRWLATHHYENFNVVSWLLPKELHQHFYNVYAYCRRMISGTRLRRPAGRWNCWIGGSANWMGVMAERRRMRYLWRFGKR